MGRKRVAYLRSLTLLNEPNRTPSTSILPIGSRSGFLEFVIISWDAIIGIWIMGRRKATYLRSLTLLDEPNGTPSTSILPIGSRSGGLEFLRMSFSVGAISMDSAYLITLLERE